MFAVIKTGGKQYKVAENDQIIIEKLEGDAGSDITFGDVLMVGEGKSVTVGAPLVSGASVIGEITEQRKGDKKIIMKKRQRSTYRRKKGHRQLETVVTIKSILADGKKAPAKKAAALKAADAPKADAAPAKAAPAKAEGGDDLTKIKGIGKVAAGKLNGEGITTYAALAGLSDARVTELEDKLSMSGKFEAWIAEAKTLA